jgi:4-hydroxy-4-methyl-2-oxoglutarate aldolase
MTEPMTVLQYLSLLRRFDTPTVCNVIELFDVRPRNEGFMDRTIKACFPEMPPIVGFATTATFRGAQPGREGDVYSSLVDQVQKILEDVPAPRIVVFQDLDDPPAAATFGEVMCTVYQSFDCVGLVTSGAARDIEQVGKLGFPCFASSTIASHGYSRTIDVNVEVTVGGLTIRPGDILHADANGVTTIPRDLVPEVALACQKLMDAEALVLDYARAGSPTVEGLRKAKDACFRRFREIPDEMRRQLER